MAILSSLLSTNAPVQASTTNYWSTNKDPKIVRRSNFVRALNEQYDLTMSPGLTRTTKVWGKDKQGNKFSKIVEVKIRSWYSNGAFEPRYGVAKLEFSPGRTALSVTENAVPELITALINATEAGELDDLLAQAAQSLPRSK